MLILYWFFKIIILFLKCFINWIALHILILIRHNVYVNILFLYICLGVAIQIRIVHI